MLVANSFHLWQKDAFFSAAEEVQQSADIMESMYGQWLRDSSYSHGQLQIALGTAKWQLDEFEKAVGFGCPCPCPQSHHKQFIDAMEDQIARVEKALVESLAQDKQTFRWVQLDDDDGEEAKRLQLFLSGTQSLGGQGDDSTHQDATNVVQPKSIPTACSSDDINSQTHSPPNWKIVIADREPAVELASKSKRTFWCQKPTKFTKMFLGLTNMPRRLQGASYTQFTPPFQLLLLLMLFTLFFIYKLFHVVASTASSTSM